MQQDLTVRQICCTIEVAHLAKGIFVISVDIPTGQLSAVPHCSIYSQDR